MKLPPVRSLEGPLSKEGPGSEVRLLQSQSLQAESHLHGPCRYSNSLYIKDLWRPTEGNFPPPPPPPPTKQPPTPSCANPPAPPTCPGLAFFVTTPLPVPLAFPIPLQGQGFSPATGRGMAPRLSNGKDRRGHQVRNAVVTPR